MSIGKQPEGGWDCAVFLTFVSLCSPRVVMTHCLMRTGSPLPLLRPSLPSSTPSWWSWKRNVESSRNNCKCVCVHVCVRVFVYLPSSLNFRSNLSVWWSSFLPSPTSPSLPPPGIESWRWWQISRKILSNRGTQSINWDKRYTALPCIVSILLIIYSLYYSLSPTYVLFGPYITTFPPSLLPLYICIRNGN